MDRRDLAEMIAKCPWPVFPWDDGGSDSEPGVLCATEGIGLALGLLAPGDFAALDETGVNRLYRKLNKLGIGAIRIMNVSEDPDRVLSAGEDDDPLGHDHDVNYAVAFELLRQHGVPTKAEHAQVEDWMPHRYCWTDGYHFCAYAEGLV